MDFRSMKRKELQALCKEHKIPANLSNLEMANRLTEFFKGKKNPLVQGLIKEQDEIASETESTNVVVDGKVKKVRFSPEHELIEFTRSPELKRRSRRNSISSRDSRLSVENVDVAEMNNENEGSLRRVTRSRLKLVESEVNEKKRGGKGVECYSQKNNVAAVENFNSGEFVEYDVDKPGPVMQLRGKILGQEVKNASKRGRKRAKDDDKTDKKALENANDEKLIEEVVDIPGRLTRSRGKKLMEDFMRKDKRRKLVENNDNAALVSAETDDSREVSRKSSKNRGIEGEGKLARGLGKRVKNNEKRWKEEVLDNKEIGGAHAMVEPQIFLRRSKRNMNGVGESETLNDDTIIHENDGMNGLRKISKLLAVESSGVDAKSAASKVDLDGGIALQIEEPIKQGQRRSNRMKNAIVAQENLEDGELKEENLNKYPLRSSVPQLENAGGVFKDDKKPLQPTGVMRRSRRKTSSRELVSGDETISTDAAMEKFKTENHLSKPCPVEKEGPAAQKNTRRSRRNTSDNNPGEILAECDVDSTIKQKNEARKRRRGPISGGDLTKTSNDSSSPTQFMRKESRSEKAAPAAATGKVSAIREPPSRMQEPSMLNASSHKDLLETGEAFVDAEFSTSEGAEGINNMGLSRDTNMETIISDVRLASSRKKQDISIADSARNADTRLINRTELANSDENAASRIAELKTDYTDTEKQISPSKLRGEEKVHSLLEFDVKELAEENILDTDKNDTAAQVFSQTEDSSCDNTINHQALLEGSIVSRNACFPETNYSADSLLPRDQTDFKSDLEAAEAEADKQAQPSLDVAEGEVECVYVQEILESVETGCTNAMISPIACHHNAVDHLESFNNILGGNNEDTSSKAGAFESCDRHIESTDSKSALQLNELSLGNLRRSLEGDNTAEGDEIYSRKGIDSEIAENDEDGCLSDHETANNENSEFNVLELYGERSARIIPQDRGHSVIISDENNYKGTSQIADKTGAFESCVEHIESIDLRSALQLEEPSSSKLRSLEGDNTAEGDKIYSCKGKDPEIARSLEGGCLRDHETATNKDSESGVPELYGERSAGIITQDRGHTIISSDENNKEDTSPSTGEVGTFGSCDGDIESTDLKSALQLEEPSPSKLRRRLEGDNAAEGDEIYSHKGIDLEEAENDKSRCSRDDETASNKDSEFNVPELYGERSARIIPQDRVHAVMTLDEHSNDALAAYPTTIIANATEINIRRDCEADQITEGETYVYKDIQSEVAEADEGGCLKDHTSTKFEDWSYGVSDLFDAERSAPSAPQGYSNLQEISPSKSNNVSESKGLVSIMSNMREIIDKETGAADTIQEREVAIIWNKLPGDQMYMDKTISDREHELLNQADEHTNKDTFEPAKQPKSPAAGSIQGPEAGSNGSETPGHAISMFKTNGKRNSSQVAEASSADKDANAVNCGKDKKDIVDASIADVSTSMDYTISKIGVESLNELKFQDIKETEHECKSALAMHTVSGVGEEPSDISSRSWTEFELNNLFGTTVDSVTPTRRNDTFCQGSEEASLNNSITRSVRSLTKKKKEMAVQGGSEYAKTTNENVLLQTNCVEASAFRSCLGSEENQLQLLFATPIKILTSCKVDKTYAHEEKLDNATMFKECVGTVKENVVTQIKSGEKVGDSGNEFENSLCVGNSLPHNGDDVASEQLNQVEGVELVNYCTIPVLSGGENDGCEASKEQLTENTRECMRETDPITEENKEEKIISRGQSCLYEEATDNHGEGTENDIISSSGALKNLDKVESCNDLLIETDLSENLCCLSRSYLRSEGELAQSSEVAVESSDADFQKSRVPENSHRGYVDGSILRETSIDNSRGPLDAEVANAGSLVGGKYVIDKGTSPKASYDDDEVVDWKDAKSIRVNDNPYHDISDTWDETDDNLRSLHDISDELHTNSKVAILKNLSVGFTPSREAHKPLSARKLKCRETNMTGTATQNADNVVPPAEHGSSACGADPDILSGMAMHLLLGENENGYIKKSAARMPLLNLEDGAERNSKVVEENSTEAIVQLSISKIHFEEKPVDTNNDIPTISDASASGCNEILKECDVADTIQEYIDSESSLSVDFEGSGVSLPIDALAHIDDKRSPCENAAVCGSKETIDDKPSVEIIERKSKELEESTVFMKLAPGSEEVVKSSLACVDLLVEGSTANKPSVETKGKELDLSSAVTETLLISKEIETSSKHLHTTPKKNSRTILIHGTPRKLHMTGDMKENAPMRKSSNISDFTSVRPAKRKALQNVHWR